MDAMDSFVGWLEEIQAGLVLAPVYFLTELSPCLHACSLRLREMLLPAQLEKEMDDNHTQLDREGNPLRTLRRRILSLAQEGQRRSKEKQRLFYRRG